VSEALEKKNVSFYLFLSKTCNRFRADLQQVCLVECILYSALQCDLLTVITDTNLKMHHVEYSVCEK